MQVDMVKQIKMILHSVDMSKDVDKAAQVYYELGTFFNKTGLSIIKLETVADRNDILYTYNFLIITVNEIFEDTVDRWTHGGKTNELNTR